nr:MAG TPA: hypothetical protein [Caudoviricetes sp.]
MVVKLSALLIPLMVATLWIATGTTKAIRIRSVKWLSLARLLR